MKMRQKKVSLGLLFLFSIGLTGIHAQEAISSAGGNAVGAGGTVSYTLGQLAYSTSTGTNGSVAQGVQQPFEISIVTELEETNNITLEWSVSPNPTNNSLKISLGNTENTELKPENLSYILYDMSGKVLLENKLDGIETTIEMGGFSSSIYILRIIQINSATLKELKTLRIIKH